jgi:hypothetical protein
MGWSFNVVYFRTVPEDIVEERNHKLDSGRNINGYFSCEFLLDSSFNTSTPC